MLRPRQFGIEHLLTLRTPTNRMPFHLSPDGELLALGLQQKTTAPRGGHFNAKGVPREMAGSAVALIDTESGETVFPFPDSSVSWSAQWSPDGRWLAAFVQHEGVACLGIWDRRTDDYRLLRNAPVKVRFGFDLPRWLPDSSGVIVVLWPEESLYPDGGESAAEKGRIEVRTSSPEQREETLPANLLHPWDLGQVDLETETVSTLTTDLRVGGGVSVSPNGKAVAIMHWDFYEARLQQNYNNLTVIDLESGHQHRLASRIGNAFGINYNWSPDSTRIAYTTSERGQSHRLYVVQADGSEEPQCLTEGEEFRLLLRYEAPRWGADGSSLFFLGVNEYWRVDADEGEAAKTSIDDEWRLRHWIVRPSEPTLWQPRPGAIMAVATRSSGGRDWVLRVDLDGGVEQLHEVPGRCTSDIWRIEVDAEKNRFFLMVEDVDRTSEIWRMDESGVNHLRSLNPVLKDVSLGRARLVSYTSPRGRQLKATALLPPHGEPPYPTIVSVYGGWTGADGVQRFDTAGVHPLHPQLLCGLGYAVMSPEIPVEGTDPLQQVTEPVLAALDHAIETGLVDEQRIGLMGTSFGGYTVAAVLTQTDRFQAAWASAPFGINMLSSYSNQIGWCETGQGGLGGSPWERRDAYIDNSPFFMLDRVTTPLLLTAGTEDQTGASQAEETFVALQRLGAEAELRLYTGEGHGPSAWSEGCLRDLWDRVAQWFGHHLATTDSTDAHR